MSTAHQLTVRVTTLFLPRSATVRDLRDFRYSGAAFPAGDSSDRLSRSASNSQTTLDRIVYARTRTNAYSRRKSDIYIYIYTYQSVFAGLEDDFDLVRLYSIRGKKYRSIKINRGFRDAEKARKRRGKTRVDGRVGSRNGQAGWLFSRG